MKTLKNSFLMSKYATHFFHYHLLSGVSHGNTTLTISEMDVNVFSRTSAQIFKQKQNKQQIT